VSLENGEIIAADHVVLAIGHSARGHIPDGSMRAQWRLHGAKGRSRSEFGIEHPQSVIDRARFRPVSREIRRWEPPTTSWCITRSMGVRLQFLHVPPGGPGRSRQRRKAGRVVTNGMSQLLTGPSAMRRGIVVAITPKTIRGDPLAGMEFSTGTGITGIQRRVRRLLRPMSACRRLLDGIASTAWAPSNRHISQEFE